jgi:hypothetical protein
MTYYNLRRKVAVIAAAGFIGLVGLCAINDKRNPELKRENLEAVSEGYYSGNDYIKDLKVRDKTTGKLYLYRGTETGFKFERMLEE